MRYLLLFFLTFVGLFGAVPETIESLRSRAEKGNAEAQFLLGMRHLVAWTVKRDAAEADRWFSSASKLGHPVAEAVSLALRPNADGSEILRLLRRAVEYGHGGGQYVLGIAYLEGFYGLSKDPGEGIRLLKLSAKNGYAPAAYHVGQQLLKIRLKGKLVEDHTAEKIVKDGLEWLEQAADGGSAWALGNLAERYWDGKDVVEDSVKAISFARRGAELGDESALFVLGLGYLLGIGIEANQSLAIQSLEVSSKSGNAYAMLHLAVRYWLGEGVARDEVRAKNLLTSAQASSVVIDNAVYSFPKRVSEGTKIFRVLAESGNPKAFGIYGQALVTGEGVAKDSVAGLFWLKRAAETGDVSSQCRIAAMYFEGDGVRKNAAEGAKWYLRAAMSGYDRAQYMMALLYSIGDAVPKNEIEALAWSYIAASSGNDKAPQLIAKDELRLGRQISLVAQQRSKEIMKNIESAKVDREKSGPVGRPPSAGTATPKLSDGGIVFEYLDEPSEASKRRQIKGNGSGVVVSAQGHVLTAAHVVTGAGALAVMTADGERAARVLRIDQANDLAVLKIEGAGLRPLQIGASRRIRLGQAVSTIGFPNIGIQGFSPKVTKGEISSMNGASDDPRSWQISVPVQPGNSGGPLLDENGHLIGVVVSKLGLKAARATGDIPQNVNYAVKISYAFPLLEQFLSEEALNQKSETKKLSFEDMISNAQKSVVLILVY